MRRAISIPEARHLCHIVVGFECGHNHVQVFHIAQVYVYFEAIVVRFPVNEEQVRDIGLLLADQCADLPQHPGVIADCQPERHRIGGRMPARVPVQIDPAVRLVLEFDQCRAVDGMNDDALPAIGDSDDALAGQRLTAGAARRRLVGSQTEDGAICSTSSPSRAASSG